jgi:hypothetical protein
LPRLLVVDEDLSTRIAVELRRRGKNAQSVASLGLRGTKDPLLLKALDSVDPDCVLITGDDAMPASHAEELATHKTTVAIIAPVDPRSQLTDDQWEHEVTQRWAHRMEAQLHGSIRRYTLDGARAWTARRRPAPRRSVTNP